MSGDCCQVGLGDPGHCWISVKLAQEEWYFPTLFQSISLRKSLFLPCVCPALARQGLSSAYSSCSPGTLGFHVKLGHGLAPGALLQQVVRGQLLTSSVSAAWGARAELCVEKGSDQVELASPSPKLREIVHQFASEGKTYQVYTLWLKNK